MTLKGQREIRQGLLRLTQPREAEFDAFVGDGYGNVEVPGHEDNWYVRPVGGDLPIVVKSGSAPKVEGVRVRIGREYNVGDKNWRGRLGIKGTVDTGGDTSIAGVGSHGDSHLAGGGDPIYIDTIQVINGLVYATSGMSVAINAGWAIIDGQPVKWSLSALNLTSDIPVTGALYALIRVDADGVIDSQPGDAAASFADLSWDDVPRVEAGYAPLAIARLYSGQTALSRLYASPDVIDLRFASNDKRGDVYGPAASTDAHLAVWDGTDSKTLKDGGAIPGGTGADGWTASGETWEYASADDPTFAFTISGDKTGKYSAGMRVKLTQSSTVKYFIVTKVAYSDPDTTVTVYGGTDYDLADATISDPYYAVVKAPHGFPLDPTKWTVEVTDTSDRSQATPTQNVWYNLGSITITIPIGCWIVAWQSAAMVYDTNVDDCRMYVSLSTANNSESDNELTSYIGSNAAPASGKVVGIITTLYRSKVLNLSAKAAYYLIQKSSNSTTDYLLLNGAQSKTIIRAVSAYL